MAKSSVTDWDVLASNNSDISGISIAEGCPASGINDAIRTLMAQFATWLVGTNAPLLRSGGAASGAITGLGNASSLMDGNGIARGIGYRSIPLTSKSGTYTVTLNDVGQGVSTSSGITLPANASTPFSIGDAIAIYNNSSANIIVSQSSGVTLRLAGSSTTGNRTLAQRGLATIFKVGPDEWVASGVGLS